MTVSGLKKGSVLQAIEVLRDLNKHHNGNSNKKSLFDDEERKTLYLQISLKKIPHSKLIQKFKVNLPHSLIKDTDEICLITGDLDKNNRKAEIEPDILHYKALLNKHDVTQISKILTLRQLRTEYKPYEAKLKLLAAYDVFLADNKIGECLPRILGKFFFKKRKLPIQINLKASNLKQQIERALSTKTFYLSGHGNSCSSEVAYSDMSDPEILDNITSMVEEISQKVPGNWNNILGIYLKTAKSEAIPIYVSYDSHNDVILEKDKELENYIEGDLSTKPNVNVRVYETGKVEMLTKKYMPETLKDSKEKMFTCIEKEINSDAEDAALVNIENAEIIEKTVPDTLNIEKKKEKRSKKRTLDADLIEKNKNETEMIEKTVHDTVNIEKKKEKRSKKKTLDADIIEINETEIIEKTVPDTFNIEKKMEKGSKKSILDAEIIEKNKSEREMIEKTVHDTVNIEKKKEKKSKKRTLDAADIIENKNETEIIEKTVPDAFNIEKKIEKGSKKCTLGEPVEKNKIAPKRKRIQCLSFTDSPQSNETPKQINKKRKLEDIEVKNQNSTKETRIKKKKQKRNKQ